MLGEVLTAIVTPFAPKEPSTSTASACSARHLVDNGSDGVVVTGTTGEAPTLTDEERFALYEAAVDEVGDPPRSSRGPGRTTRRTRSTSPSARTRSGSTASSS